MGSILILSAPSGTGKTAVSSELVKINHTIKRVITHTTRRPRNIVNEKDGVDYYFISKDEFLKHKNNNYFIETAQIYGNYYGTSRQEVDKIIRSGKHALLVIDVQGAASLRKLNLKNSIFLFIKPPSFEKILERLTLRGTENKTELDIRLGNYKKEMSQIKYFDEVIVNDDLQKTVHSLNRLIQTKYGKTTNFEQ